VFWKRNRDPSSETKIVWFWSFVGVIFTLISTIPVFLLKKVKVNESEKKKSRFLPLLILVLVLVL
jgi:hypothetical protein